MCLTVCVPCVFGNLVAGNTAESAAVRLIQERMQRIHVTVTNYVHVVLCPPKLVIQI